MKKFAIIAAIIATSLVGGLLLRPHKSVERTVSFESRSGLTPAGLPRASVPTVPVYGHSLQPGGIWSLAALKAEVEGFHLDFNPDLARTFFMAKDQCVRTAYLHNGKVFWTKQCVIVHKGELIYTDGTHYIRARCGNLIALDPQVPTEAVEVTDTEIPVGVATAEVPNNLPPIQGIVAPPSGVTPPGVDLPPSMFPPVIIPGPPPVRVPDGDCEWFMFALVIVVFAFVFRGRI